MRFDRLSPTGFLLALLCGSSLAAAQPAREPVPASRVAPLPVQPVAPPAEVAPGTVSPPPAGAASPAAPAATPPVSAPPPPKRAIEEGPYSDDEEAAREAFHEWRKHRYDRPFKLALSASYGVALDNTAQNSAGMIVALPNPYQTGFGVSFGYTTPRYNIYMGAAGSYYLGTDEFSVLRTSLDVGYTFLTRWLVIVPVMSVGLSTLLIADPAIPHQYNAFFGLGLLFGVPFGPFFIGLENRMDFVGGRSLAAANTMGISGLFGLRL